MQVWSFIWPFSISNETLFLSSDFSLSACNVGMDELESDWFDVGCSWCSSCGGCWCWTLIEFGFCKSFGIVWTFCWDLVVGNEFTSGFIEKYESGGGGIALHVLFAWSIARVNGLSVGCEGGCKNGFCDWLSFDSIEFEFVEFEELLIGWDLVVGNEFTSGLDEKYESGGGEIALHVLFDFLASLINGLSVGCEEGCKNGFCDWLSFDSNWFCDWFGFESNEFEFVEFEELLVDWDLVVGNEFTSGLDEKYESGGGGIALHVLFVWSVARANGLSVGCEGGCTNWFCDWLGFDSIEFEFVEFEELLMDWDLVVGNEFTSGLDEKYESGGGEIALHVLFDFLASLINGLSVGCEEGRRNGLDNWFGFDSDWFGDWLGFESNEFEFVEFNELLMDWDLVAGNELTSGFDEKKELVCCGVALNVLFHRVAVVENWLLVGCEGGCINVFGDWLKFDLNRFCDWLGFDWNRFDPQLDFQVILPKIQKEKPTFSKDIWLTSLNIWPIIYIKSRFSVYI